VPPFSDREHLCTVTRIPLGVCALVTPWNHPLLIAVKKASVALATGNCVVVKPPEVAPCSVVELGRIFKAAGLPDGVRHGDAMALSAFRTTLVLFSAYHVIPSSDSIRPSTYRCQPSLPPS
jgi:hypothetical protein